MKTFIALVKALVVLLAFGALFVTAGVVTMFVLAKKAHAAPALFTLDKPAIFTFDMGAGEARSTPPPDGQYYQKPFPNSVRTIDNVHSLGFSLQASSYWTLGLHYATLGQVAIDAAAVTCPHDDCDHFRDNTKDFHRAECVPFNEDNCQYRWVSSGRAKGMLGTLALRVFDMGAIGFDLRAGAFFHQLKYAAVVETLGCQDDPSCRLLNIEQKARYGLAPVLGVGVKYAPSWLYGGFVAFTWDRFFRMGEHIEVTAGFKGPTDRTMIFVGAPF